MENEFEEQLKTIQPHIMHDEILNLAIKNWTLQQEKTRSDLEIMKKIMKKLVSEKISRDSSPSN